MIDNDRIYAGVVCRGHGDDIAFVPCGNVDITAAEYMRQMSKPDAFWHCPRCGGSADFDDDRFEELNPIDVPDEDHD